MRLSELLVVISTIHCYRLWVGKYIEKNILFFEMSNVSNVMTSVLRHSWEIPNLIKDFRCLLVLW